MKMDPFIDTAILAEQTVQNAARPRDTTLKALAQKAGWRISQTLPPDFVLRLDVETAVKPLLNVYTRYDKHGYPTKRIQIPADERVSKLLSEYAYDKDKPAYPVYNGNRNVVGCLT